MTKEELKKVLDEGVRQFSGNNYEKAIEYWEKIPKDNEVYLNTQGAIGVAYGRLGKFEKAIEHLEKIPKSHDQYFRTQNNVGLVFILMHNSEKASEAFINSQKEVFELFSLFNREDIKEDATNTATLKQVLSKVLDSKKYDFFNTTIKGDIDNRDKYKEIFIRSLYTISLLHVSSNQEKQVAHYTRKSSAEKMLFAKSKVRLSSTIEANDPKEGVTLLDFLGIENKAHLQTPYQAFIACFTFNPESLNQFRLYGKEDNKEATGVSIIVKNEFFNSSAGITGLNTKSDLTIQTNTSKVNSKEETPVDEKHSLYRCVYIDPKTKKIISIGHKEEYNFYRENKEITEAEVNKYKADIDNILKEVHNQMNELSSFIEYNPTLDKNIISELLLPLRHLTKHVAFKEEQECRIFDIENLHTSNKIKPQRNQEEDCDKQKFNKMYIEYNYNLELSECTKKVIFAPITNGIDQFQAFAKYLGHNFECERCDHPFFC